MSGSARAQEVLGRVVAGAGSVPWGDSNLVTEVVEAWAETDDVFCLVYRQLLYGDLLLGLRRVVEPDWTIDGVVDEILSCELGEPLGSVFDELVPDDAGVHWWNGNPDEWKTRR
jgi:hypothetical protein